MKENIGLGAHGALFAGRYEIVKTLGEGGMGRVYLAKDTLLDGYLLALKTLRPDLCKNEEGLKRFFQEVQLNRKVNHPNVVRIFDVGRDEETVYFTMEYVEGISLKDKIARGPMQFEEVKRIMRDICSGLAAIHAAGIVHRDLKPGNVMLEAGGNAKIADFGIATTATSDITAHNELLGCAHYIAPEIWKGKDATSKTDLYSVGVILYEMITGKTPFNEGSPTDLLRQHLCSPVPEIKNESIPSYLKRICLNLLSKNESDRPAHALEVVQKLAGTSTSISVSSDDFVRPTVVTGLPTQQQMPAVTKLPDYSILKRKTNPDTYRSSNWKLRSAAGDWSSNSKSSSMENHSTIGGHAAGFSLPWIVRAFISLALVATIATITEKFLLPWSKLVQLSLTGSTSINFVLTMAMCAVGISLLFSTPAAIVAALKPNYMQEKKVLIMWGEFTCILLGILTSLLCWELFRGGGDIIKTLTSNPTQLYSSFRRAAEMLLYVGLFIPKFVLKDQAILYYTCIGFYALGVFAIFQSHHTGRNIIFWSCLLLLPLVLAAEYYIPIYATESVYEWTVTNVSFQVGEYNFSMSQFALGCGIANWTIILFLVQFIRKILGFEVR